MATIKMIYKGGPGSGHHGHVGRPGQIGGSSRDLATIVIDKLPTWAKNMKNVKLTPSVNILFEDNIMNASVNLEHVVSISGTLPTGIEFDNAYTNSHVSGSIDHNNKLVKLSSIFVDESLRGKGVARAMLVYLRKYMNDNGYNDYKLTTSNVFSDAGRAFSRRMLQEGLLDI